MKFAKQRILMSVLNMGIIQCEVEVSVPGVVASQHHMHMLDFRQNAYHTRNWELRFGCIEPLSIFPDIIRLLLVTPGLSTHATPGLGTFVKSKSKSSYLTFKIAKHS